MEKEKKINKKHGKLCKQLPKMKISVIFLPLHIDPLSLAPFDLIPSLLINRLTF